MSAFLNQQLTNVGWDALSMALGGGRLTFFKMQAGSGTIANDSAINSMTRLVQPVCDIGITKYTIEGDGQVTLWGNISSAQLDVGFNLKEIGVFATIEPPVAGKGGVPTGPNITVFQNTPGVQANPIVPNPPVGTALMYSYCNSYINTDYIPGKGETTDVVNTVQVVIKIDKASQVVINVTQGQQMDVANIGPPTVGAGVWSYTQANIAWLKRLKPGAQTLITEDANTITIGQKQLTSDLDLYVANGNPDISPNFSSINNAMGYLGQYIIPTSVQARIHVSKGFYYSPDPQWVYHPNGQSITISGPPTNWQWSNSTGIGGSSWNWTMTLYNLANTSQFTVGYYAIVWGPGGISTANHCLLCGYFRVTAVGPNWVSVSVPNYRTSFPIGGPISSLWIMPVQVNIACTTVNQYAMVIGPAGLGSLNFVGFVCAVQPTGTCNALAVIGDASLNYVGVANWNMQLLSTAQNVICGLIAWGHNVSCNYCAVTNCQMGFVSGSAQMSLNGCSSSYNSVRALWVEGVGNASFVYTYSFIGASSGGMGIVVANNSTCGVVSTSPNPGYAVCQNNDHYGLWVVSQGDFAFSSTICYIWLQNNGLGLGVHYDIVVQNFGLFNSNAQAVGTRIFNSPVGQINSSGGYIG